MVETGLMVGISMMIGTDTCLKKDMKIQTDTSVVKEGKMHPDDFLDWLSTVELVFDYYDP